MKKIKVTGEQLTLNDIISVSLRVNGQYAQVELPNLDKVQRAKDYIAQKVIEGKIIYGVTTGFGSNVDKVIKVEFAEQLQINLLRSHACGVGDNFSVHIVRAIMLIRLNTLVKGYSGVQVSTVKQIQDFLNYEIHPVTPQQGSVGASGDLCPLSHMALPLIGEGYVEYKGLEYKAQDFYNLPEIRGIGLSPIKLSYKEGLALNNGTTVMTALGVIAVHDFENTIKLATLSSCLMFEALCARKQAFDAKIHEIRNHQEQKMVASWIRSFTKDSTFVGISSQTLKGKFDELADKKVKPQDSYSIRCLPQVFGASLKALNHVKEILIGEINAAVDNPLLFVEEDEVLSGGNFHGQPLALALDYLKLAIAEVGNITERQINKLVDKNTNDCLGSFLINDENHINSGLMIPQYVAASLVSENKVLVHPASADSIPTCANTEDHVSMGTIAGRQAIEILGNVKNILAIALLTGHHAVEIRKQQFKEKNIVAQLSNATYDLFVAIKNSIEDFSNDGFLNTDRFLFDDIKALKAELTNFVNIPNKYIIS